ncbi:MAG: winged helix-turn-helix transcriptional regulator [Verrucomicrobiae bacterium]|nr:winged helix-turn-helix transcriptional regulator [Verrucomicrobiae bacterium]
MLKALADETRWRIIRELLTASMTVNELTDRIGATQYNVSKHLRILREAGIVEAQKTGVHVQCKVADGFRQMLTKGEQQLDLGCCTFRFDCPPKPRE